MSETQCCDKFILQDLSRILHIKSPGTTKESFHCLWDNCIVNPLKTFCTSLQTNRNTNHNNSTGNLRPNMFGLIYEIAIFRGEEKGPTTNIEDDPFNELIDKIQLWIYHGNMRIFKEIWFKVL